VLATGPQCTLAGSTASRHRRGPRVSQGSLPTGGGLPDAAVRESASVRAPCCRRASSGRCGESRSTLRRAASASRGPASSSRCGSACSSPANSSRPASRRARPSRRAGLDGSVRRPRDAPPGRRGTSAADAPRSSCPTRSAAEAELVRRAHAPRASAVPRLKGEAPWPDSTTPLPTARADRKETTNWSISPRCAASRCAQGALETACRRRAPPAHVGTARHRQERCWPAASPPSSPHWKRPRRSRSRASTPRAEPVGGTARRRASRSDSTPHRVDGRARRRWRRRLRPGEVTLATGGPVPSTSW
jgi:hypothetical protein